MAADDAGVLERMWRCSGRRVVERSRSRKLRLLVAGGLLPLLLIPRHYHATRREEAFGWAMAQVAVERQGWLPLVTQLVAFDAACLAACEAPSDVAD